MSLILSLPVCPFVSPSVCLSVFVYEREGEIKKGGGGGVKRVREKERETDGKGDRERVREEGRERG